MDNQLYEVPLMSGEILIVKPISPFLRPVIYEAVKREHPEPDPELYKRPLENAFEEGLKEAAEDNPEYVKARKKALQEQLFAFNEKVVRAGVAVQVKGEEREVTIGRYAAQLKEIRAMCPDAPEDDWTATVMYCLVSSVVDMALIRELSSEQLTQEEIAAAANSFRLQVQRTRRVGHPDKQSTSGVSAGSRKTAKTGRST